MIITFFILNKSVKYFIKQEILSVLSLCCIPYMYYTRHKVMFTQVIKNNILFITIHRKYLMRFISQEFGSDVLLSACKSTKTSISWVNMEEKVSAVRVIAVGVEILHPIWLSLI